MASVSNVSILHLRLSDGWRVCPSAPVPGVSSSSTLSESQQNRNVPHRAAAAQVQIEKTKWRVEICQVCIPAEDPFVDPPVASVRTRDRKPTSGLCLVSTRNAFLKISSVAFFSWRKAESSRLRVCARKQMAQPSPSGAFAKSALPVWPLGPLVL